MVSEKIGAIAAALIMATVCGYLYAWHPAVGISYAVYVFLMRKTYVVTYLPFEGSDMTLESLEFGKDENEAQKEFEMHHLNFRIKEIKEQ